MNKKICIKCKIEKDGNLFSIKNKYFSKKKQKTVFYYNPICKICDSKRLDKLKNKTNRCLTPDGNIIWQGVLGNIRRRARKRKVSFDISYKDFLLWLKNTFNKCYYCEIDLSSLKLINKNLIKQNIYKKDNSFVKSPRFQVDRKDNDNKIGYTIENICFACHICNTHKGNFFTSDEFKLIAQKFIKPKYLKQLNKIV